MLRDRTHVLLFPREHGAWGILLVPLVTGAATGLLAGGRWLPLLPFTIAVIALFWLRTPVETWLGITPARVRSEAELRLVRRAVLSLGGIAAAGLVWLFWGGRNPQLAPLGALAAAAFLVQVLLKRRSRMASQLIGAAGLTSPAPAAYYLTTGHLTAMAWALWMANFLFAANQIQFVQLRIHAARITVPASKLAAGAGFLLAQLALSALLVIACAAHFFPWFAALAFVPLLFRGFAWFARESRPLAVRRLGWTELTHAAAFAVLLVSLLQLR